MAYTTIDDPSAHFQTATWTGSSGTDTITFDGNSDLQLDWLWSKSRSNAHSHALMDTSRITSGDYLPLFADTTDVEQTFYDSELQSILSDGFTVGTQPHAGGDGKTYVGFAWKANGGSTTTNDASATGVGNTDSVYQANTTAGFSIVTWTGPSGSDARTMAHGLGGTPELIIYKNRDESVAWYVGTSAITFNFNTDYLQLNANIAKATDAGGTVFVSAPTSTVIGASSSAASGKENIKYVAYCFRSIQGYSKIGSYTGNGNADGPFVYTGFKPAWLLIKRTDSAQNWNLHDNKRSTFNTTKADLFPNLDNAEETGNGNFIDFLSNGFKHRASTNSLNASSGDFIYMAFAEHPFVSSKGVPVTAR